MIDPIAQSTAAASSAPGTAAAATAAAAAAQPPAALPPAETRMFATLMQGSPVAPTPSGGAFSDVAASLGTQFGKTRSFEEIRHSMLNSFDPSDPIKSMFVMTSDGMEAHMLFTRLHISTSLASAATSLFGSLLKNQQ